MQKVYLDNIPLQEAQDLLKERIAIPRRTEKIKVQEALGRITADGVYAKTSMPNFHASAMDGIAVRSKKTIGADEQRPMLLSLTEDFQPIDTGDPIPEDFDAVIMIEDIQWINNKQVEILAPASPWQHVRSVGEDVVAGEMIVPIFHKLSPPDLGALLAGGVIEIEVLAKPRVAIIPTGSELVEPGQKLDKGEITDFNSTVLKAYVDQWGGIGQPYPIIKDDLELLKQGVLEALAHSDLLVINAGSSAGSQDYTVEVIRELGEVFVHGINTKPGKPVILGVINNKPVIGLPGYPVSAYLALEWFVLPLINSYLGLAHIGRTKATVTLGRRIVSAMGKEEFVRMSLGNVEGKYIANPLNRGAGITMSLVKAHGILRIPANSLGYEQGEKLQIELLKPVEEIKNTIVSVGSHDLTLDLLAMEIRKENKELFLSSSHVGSMGALLSIAKGEAHMGGIHLLDPETGQYNIPYAEKYLTNNEVVLVNLVFRQQGLILPEGNPKGIKNLQDLIDKKLVFINRQKGAGTRILFDYLIKEKDLNPQEIIGYTREEFSHLGVAAQVMARTADVGMGIKSAAQAYNLAFIPLGEERYDLLLTREFFESFKGKDLLKIISSTVFKDKVEALGGYCTRESGKILWDSAKGGN